MGQQGEYLTAMKDSISRENRSTAKAPTFTGINYPRYEGSGTGYGYAGNVDYFNLKKNKPPINYWLGR